MNMSIKGALISHNRSLYREYINNHKLNVQKAWDNMKNNSDCMELISRYIPSINMELIEVNIEAHDESKYSKEEFEAYRKEFYPVCPEEKENNKAAFDEAWKHHYTNNLHHWNWWSESGNQDSMSLIYVIEMICDWEAMGHQFGNTSKEWYNDNKHKINLGNRQREFAEALMDIICK